MVTIPDPQTGFKPTIEDGGQAKAPLPAPSAGRRRVYAALVLLAMLAATLALALKNPVEVLGGGGCPTKRLAGVYCPGCGSLRASHSLLTGDAHAAWRHNPLMVAVGVPCAAWLAIAYSTILITGRPVRVAAAPPAWLLWSAAALLIVWGLVRNIPIDALDWTRPPEPAHVVR